MPSKAKQQAMRDIQAELEKQKKHFIPFRSELDDTMRQLVSDHLRRQTKKSNNKQKKKETEK